ncbi:MAG: ATP-grasp domain-containing protein [Planctomycetales bacterium]|nr:ATP-grasp domain-containing protein [Planctomycetales bacterium]
MERANILLTSAGRRGVLVKLFQRELRELFPQAKVFATDLRPKRSSACQLADGYFETPRVTDPGYIDRLGEICQAAGVRVIVPTIDTELLVLAEAREQLAERGVAAVVADPALVRDCRDKRRTHELFRRHGLLTAQERDPRAAETDYPLFAKPYDGSCSVNIHLLASRADVTPALLADPKLMFLEYLAPELHDEFTVDIYYDRLGNLRCLVPRQRLETRAGEVSKGRTVWRPEFDSLADCLRHIEGARGCLTVQVFVSRDDAPLIYGIEINPRFGGGYPLTDGAGARYVRWLLLEYLLNEPVVDFDQWERNLTMLRYDDHVLVRD